MNNLLSPKSVAVVGASDRSGWSNSALTNFEKVGFSGDLYLVNRRGGIVHGHQAYASCAEIGAPIDLALLLVGADTLPAALEDVAAAGISTAVVLAAGFSETGDAGHRAQEQIVSLATRFGITLVGPNCLGFVNMLDKVAAWSAQLPPLMTGSVAVVSQSGATAHTIAAFAGEQGIGVSHVVSTGNEGMLDTVEMAMLLVDDPRVRSIAMFMESIRDPARFCTLARRAASLEKPVVALKVGSSVLAAEIAMSHTGALVGDDRLIDTAFAQYGVVRADSIEELVITAGLLAHTGPLPEGGLGVVSMSGGACDLIADRAENLGVELPGLAADTRLRLSEVLPNFCTVRNPLDATGAASADPSLFRDAIEAIATDPAVALTAAIHVLPTEERGDRIKQRLEIVAPAFAAAVGRTMLVDQTISVIDESTVMNMDSIGIPYAINGIHHMVQAVGHAISWSKWLRKDRGEPTTSGDRIDVDTTAAWSEADALKLLSSQGVPVVQHRHVTTQEDAVVASAELGFPVVVKLVSPEILHKSDIGGVVLNVDSEDAVRLAFERVEAAARSVPEATMDGVLVSTMRSGGLELIVGVVVDPQWGPTLAVGFGGIWVHIADDTALRILPVTKSDIAEMLSELRGASLFAGARGSKPVDMDHLAGTILDIVNLAGRLGDQLLSLEINPLRVDGSTIEALDAAIEWI
ncbi:acetate--CoA ligase family protein [Nocardia jiangxiensis]|uniref:acetate--CoA ligase family protein n=1 Tax=Nocardia jiangxiensis TaxID=282685 RepID=UPI00030E6E75|nr:acetate--CoA ligase family protein [Nocardia jiangxiensis]